MNPYAEAFFPIDYMVVIDEAFKSLPIKQTLAYQCYKTIWLKDRSRFNIINKLHQNGLHSVLHFSVEVDVCDGWKHRLHFNGFFKDMFNLCNIEASTIDRGVWVKEQIAILVE